MFSNGARGTMAGVGLLPFARVALQVQQQRGEHHRGQTKTQETQHHTCQLRHKEYHPRTPRDVSTTYFDRARVKKTSRDPWQTRG